MSAALLALLNANKEIDRLTRERDAAIAQRDRVMSAGWAVVRHGTIDPYEIHKALERVLLTDAPIPDRLAAERAAGRREGRLSDELGDADAE